jgi:hypothetical protein
MWGLVVGLINKLIIISFLKNNNNVDFRKHARPSRKCVMCDQLKGRIKQLITLGVSYL